MFHEKPRPTHTYVQLKETVSDGEAGRCMDPLREMGSIRVGGMGKAQPSRQGAR
jgi:hypothetical protein